MGMAIFFIFYGLAEVINSIYVYITKKEWFNLIATAFWGLTFIFVGVTEIIPLNHLKAAAQVIYGLAWLPMLFTPCAIKILRKNKWTLRLRKVVFLIISLWTLADVFWK